MHAIVVGAVDIGESDRILRFLTAEQGRVSMVARQARSSKKRWAGLLDAGNELIVERGRGRGSLAVLRSAELVAAPRRAREALERIAWLSYGCELCASLAPEEQPAPKLYRLLRTWLDLLEGDVDVGSAARVALDAKALTFAGLTPALVRCVRCGLALEGTAVFDAEAGGALHQHCGGGRRVDSRALAFLEELRRTPLFAVAGRGPPPPGTSGLLTDFVQHQLGRALRSRALVEELAGPG